MGKRDRNLYYGKKLLLFLGSVFLLSVVVFYVARLAPGDPLVSYYGNRNEKMAEDRITDCVVYHYCRMLLF